MNARPFVAQVEVRLRELEHDLKETRAKLEAETAERESLAKIVHKLQV